MGVRDNPKKIFQSIISIFSIAKYNSYSTYVTMMAPKDVVQNELDYLNAVMSSVIVGGLIGFVILIIQSPSISPINIYLGIGVIAFVGWYVRKQRKKFLLELKKWNKAFLTDISYICIFSSENA
ncbi:MAG: hypothetical protein A2W22_01785 [Candidatus Levybacteria bacterium RBG_16_35_11]|nr:MAG: hypothetical protein A2W22_01785 [Candidatus Levybacteria bacterium RBG_16_35_11]